MDSRILQIETFAMHAWPAQEIFALGGWLLRTHPAPSRRVNSVWPNAWNGNISLAQMLERVEAYYAEKGRPARYQVCPAALPVGLEDVLEARGYAIDAPTNVQIAPVDEVLQRNSPVMGLSVEIFDTLTESWVAAYCRAQGAPESDAPARMAALARIEQPVCYAQVHLDGRIVAVGRGVFEDGWMGVFGMATHSDYRRMGAGTAVMFALATCAQERGAADLYLQVMQNNDPALKMYAGLGFKKLYTYCYRTLAPAGAD